MPVLCTSMRRFSYLFGVAAAVFSRDSRAQCPITIAAFPYQEGFEASAAWSSGGAGNDWAWGTPSKPVITGAAGGTKCWIVGGLTTSSYSPGEQSWLESPCFDFSALPIPYISFKLFWECERTYDGLGFQYSLDQGASWSNVGSVADQPDCYTQNWFNSASINNLDLASPSEGWSGRVGATQGSCLGGQGSGAWLTSSHCLAWLGGEPSVKFRFAFGAGTTCNGYDGVAVDDVFIGEAPSEPNPVQWTCFGDTLSITGMQTCADSWAWDFGDPASGAANTSVQQTPEHVFSAPGTYNVTLTLSYSCRAPQVVPFSVTVLDLQIITSNPTCAGNDGSAEAIVSGAAGAISYLWNPGGYTTSAVSDLSAGTYAFVANATGACPIGQLFALEPPASSPSASISSTPVTCFGFSDGTAAVLVNGGTPAYSFSWTPNGGTGSSANGLSAGTYTCTVTDAANCATSVTVTVDEPDAIVVTAQDDAALCLGDSITLTASATGGTPGFTFDWSPQGPAVSPSSTAAFTVTATDANGCVSAPDEVVVSIGSVATPTFTVFDTLGCSPHCASFTADNPSDELVWDFGDGTTTTGLDEVRHCFMQGGTFDVTLTATSADGCSGSWTLLAAVDALPSPVADFTVSPAVSTIEEPLISFFDQSIGADSLVWSFGVGDSSSSAPRPTFAYDSVACYTVRLSALNDVGCSSSFESQVCIESPFGLWVPNAITPNGDGFNDRFFAVTTVQDPREFELLIFNRWGQAVFSGASPEGGWDAASAPDGVYAWKLRIRDTLGDRHERFGHVTVLR